MPHPGQAPRREGEKETLTFLAQPLAFLSSSVGRRLWPFPSSLYSPLPSPLTPGACALPRARRRGRARGGAQAQWVAPCPSSSVGQVPPSRSELRAPPPAPGRPARTARPAATRARQSQAGHGGLPRSRTTFLPVRRQRAGHRRLHGSGGRLGSGPPARPRLGEAAAQGQQQLESEEARAPRGMCRVRLSLAPRPPPTPTTSGFGGEQKGVQMEWGKF